MIVEQLQKPKRIAQLYREVHLIGLAAQCARGCGSHTPGSSGVIAEVLIRVVRKLKALGSEL